MSLQSSIHQSFNSEPYIVLLNCCDKSKCDNLKTINYSHTVNIKAGPIWNIIIGLWQQLLTRPVKSFTCDDIDWWNHQFIVRVCPCLQLFKLGQRIMWVTFILKECERGIIFFFNTGRWEKNKIISSLLWPCPFVDKKSWQRQYNVLPLPKLKVERSSPIGPLDPQRLKISVSDCSCKSAASVVCLKRTSLDERPDKLPGERRPWLEQI